MRRIYSSIYVLALTVSVSVSVCNGYILLRFSRNNSIYALNKTSIVAKAIADNDKYMERKHVKPVIEFIQRRWKYHKPGRAIKRVNFANGTETTVDSMIRMH